MAEEQVLEQEEEAAVEAEDQVAEAGEAQDGDEPAQGEAQSDEVVVSIGEPDPEAEEQQKAAGWVKKLRKKNRELERDLREARRKLNEAGGQKEPELGPKPTLEGCDYDAAKFEAALDSWHGQKRKKDEAAAKAEADAKAADDEWKARLASYQEAKGKLGVKDFEDAEAVVMDLLDQTQQGIIVHGAADAALVIYALGKNEDKARELAAIKDPVKFAFAVARLEGQVKMGKKPATAPEARVGGSGKAGGAVDSTLERLRAEAAKTGDYSKVIAYKNSKKQG